MQTDLQIKIDELTAENERLTKILNTPMIEEFVEATKAEAAHQTWRWGEEHDAKKTPEEWYELISYLAGKALQAHIDGDRRTGLHHTISSAAALMHWHQAIQRQYPRKPTVSKIPTKNGASRRHKTVREDKSRKQLSDLPEKSP